MWRHLTPLLAATARSPSRTKRCRGPRNQQPKEKKRAAMLQSWWTSFSWTYSEWTTSKIRDKVHRVSTWRVIRVKDKAGRRSKCRAGPSQSRYQSQNEKILIPNLFLLKTLQKWICFSSTKPVTSLFTGDLNQDFLQIQFQFFFHQRIIIGNPQDRSSFNASSSQNAG